MNIEKHITTPHDGEEYGSMQVCVSEHAMECTHYPKPGMKQWKSKHDHKRC